MSEQNKPAEPLLRWVNIKDRLPEKDWFGIIQYYSSDLDERKYESVTDWWLGNVRRWLEKIPLPNPSLTKEGETKVLGVAFYDVNGKRTGFVAKEEQQPEGEVPGQFTQAFEKYQELTVFIQQMASSGMVPHGSAWTSFLYELNKICSEIQTLQRWLEGEAQANRNIVDQNCTLLQERDRSNASFKKMLDLFDLKILEAKDYRDVLQEVWDNRTSTLLVETFKRVINVLSRYPSTPEK